MTNDNKLILEASLLGIWNNRDSKSRMEEMGKIYSEEIRFYESEDGAPVVGYENINNVIEKLQSQWPLAFKFTPSKPARKNHDLQVAAWTLGIPGESPAASGQDIALIEDGKISSLYLFLDM